MVSNIPDCRVWPGSRTAAVHEIMHNSITSFTYRLQELEPINTEVNFGT